MENFIFGEVLTTINLHQSLPSVLVKALINISKLKQDQTCTICHWTTWNSLQIIHKKFFIIFWTFLHFNIPWCSWTTVACYSDACLKWLHIANIIWIVSSQPYWSSSSWKILNFFVLLFWDKDPLRIWSSFCSVFFCVCTENRHLRKSGHNKWSLSLRIAYENVKKSARNCGYVFCVKVSVLGVFLVRIFWYWDWIRTRYSVFLRIQSECGKMRTRKTPNTDTFNSVVNFIFCAGELPLNMWTWKYGTEKLSI